MIRGHAGSAIIAAILMLSCACGVHSSSFTGQNGITGIVLAGPQCPAEVIGRSCPPRAVSARVTVTNQLGRNIATFTSDTHGHFRVRLAPGTYELITTQTHQPQLLRPVRVTVKRGRYTRLRLLLDTGIR